MMAKLRVSSHNLQVEMGRGTNTPREQRRCHCGEDVEDEQHFLQKCSAYTDIRLKYEVNESNQNISNILNSKSMIPYITELYERRKYVSR